MHHKQTKQAEKKCKMQITSLCRHRKNPRDVWKHLTSKQKHSVNQKGGWQYSNKAELYNGIKIAPETNSFKISCQIVNKSSLIVSFPELLFPMSSVQDFWN